eukprot:TRINITY_DN13143_c1_g2_i1.p1 TRINITY_DN13143_c1_g2~~TRINITY_DN13143_c1_g2_i1.p1  ORF type:complete len:400 (-),score=56.43 TRINITY_DN13143_c1_g2_i1:86-1285(-)
MARKRKSEDEDSRPAPSPKAAVILRKPAAAKAKASPAKPETRKSTQARSCKDVHRIASPSVAPAPSAAALRTLATSPEGASEHKPLSSEWVCGVCTLLNPIARTICEACESVKGSQSGSSSSSSSSSSRSSNPRASVPTAKEERLRRYISQPNYGLCERIERALAQRLYLLGMERHADGIGATFKVLGSTGNVYTVELDLLPNCDCPDYLKGRGLCKHILFIWLRVLRISEDDPRIWQNALLTTELRTAVEAVFKRRAKAKMIPLAGKEVREAYRKASKTYEDLEDLEKEDGETGKDRRLRKPLEGEDCPVCFEAMEQSEESSGRLTFCCSCGNNFHHDCIRRWQHASTGTCPLCRESWQKPSKHVSPGEALPAAALPQSRTSGKGFCSGGYLNLSGLG